jgi:hypothetical protein
MTAPGETVARSFLLTDLFPVTARSGKYTLEASVTLDGGIEPRSSDHGSTEYMVVAPANTDVVRDVIEPFGAALAAVQGGSVLTLETVEALERVLSDPDPAVAYLAEPALYYLALLDARLPRQVQVLIRDDQKIDLSERRPATRAVEEFERFLQLYPNSSFAAKAMEGLRRARSRLRRMDEHHRR